MLVDDHEVVRDGRGGGLG